MPKYSIKDPISGEAITVSAARAPTQQEALKFLSSRQEKIRQQSEAQSPGAIEAQNLNEALRQQNLEQIYGAIPLRGATEAAKVAYEASTDLAGDNLGGKILGLIAGGGAALGTAFNPITKAASNIPTLVQSISEALGSQSAGGQAPFSAQTLTGEREIIPLKEFGDSDTGNVSVDTAGNLLSSALNFIQKDPVNAALALEGARRPGEVFRGAVGATEAAVGGLKKAPAAIAQIVDKVTPSIVKRGVDIITKVPDAFKKDVGRVATDVFKPVADTAKSELIKDIETGRLHDDLRNIQEFGKPKNAEQMLENGLIATDNLINLHKDFIKQFPDEIISNADIAQTIRNESTSKELSSPSEKNAALDFAEKIDGERSLDRSFKLLQELNERRRAYYEKSSRGQATDLDNSINALEQQARDLLSAKLDNFYRNQTGATDNPYRQYGSLKGRLDDLTLRLNNLLTERNIEVSKGLSLDREVLSTVKKNLKLLKGGEKGRIDNRISRMFDLLEREPTTNLRDLTAEEIATQQP